LNLNNSKERIQNGTVAVGLSPQRHSAWPGKVAWPIWPFWPTIETGELFSPIGTGGLPAKSSRPAAGGRRWSGRGASSVDGEPDTGWRTTRCSPEQGVPWRRNSSGEECRWWRGGVAEGVGKVVEGAHNVGAELGAVSRGSERAVRGGSAMASKAAQWQ
jgi:hypothetical protein